jgi:hypothetical protein
MSEPNPVQPLDAKALEHAAHIAIAANDLDDIGTCIERTLEAQRRFLTLAQEEDRSAMEIAREQARERPSLAGLSEDEARKRHHEAEFQVTYRRDRAVHAQRTAESLGVLLTTLRKASATVQGRQLAERCLLEGERLQDEIELAKKGLEPLFHLFERAFSLQREIETYNQQVEAGDRLPAPVLRGDPGVVRRVGEIRLEIPNAWRERLKREPERRQARDLLAESIGYRQQ